MKSKNLKEIRERKNPFRLSNTPCKVGVILKAMMNNGLFEEI